METIESTEAVQPTPEPQLILTDAAQYYLQKAGQWAYFLGIVGFVLTGFILLGALFMGTFFGAMSKFQPAEGTPYSAVSPGAMGAWVSFLYVIFAVFYFFFSLYLYQFGDKIKSGILYSNTTDVTTALSKLKSFFKMWGITTIVIVGLYILIFVIMIVAGIGAASMMAR
ncbi:hypothetical protein FFF34_001450 [Inquilinus sp. KBS0705]|nr:hypothetical protein FFF34_001450 [Inquilinus sp. KBS0705]